MMLFLSFVLLEGAGGGAGEAPVPTGLSGSGEPLSLGLYGQYHPRGKLRKAGEEKTVKFVPPCDAALSLCATPSRWPGAGGGPSAAAPRSLLSREDGNVPLPLLAAYGSRHASVDML